VSSPSHVPLISLDHDLLVAWIAQSATHPHLRCVHTAIAGDDAHIIAEQWYHEADNLICVATAQAALVVEHTPQRAWIRGPLGDVHQQRTLWDALLPMLPTSIDTIDVFPDQAATTIIDTWQQLGFQTRNTVHIMQLDSIPTGHWQDAFTTITPDDSAALQALHNDHFSNSWGTINDMLAPHPHHHLALSRTAHGVINGYVWLRYDPLDRRATIEYIAVATPYHRQGIGQQLVAHAIAWAHRHQAQIMSLTVDAQREAAYALYTANGFQTSASGVHMRQHRPTGVTA
jgi:ribosomal protein S18 acetylase RimI-like enzyme